MTSTRTVVPRIDCPNSFIDSLFVITLYTAIRITPSKFPKGRCDKVFLDKYFYTPWRLIHLFHLQKEGKKCENFLRNHQIASHHNYFVRY